MDYIRPKIFDRHPIRKDELVLVELKKDGNHKVGAISEPFFYCSLMRDALGGVFKFEGRPSKRNCAVSTEAIKRCSSTYAVLLAPAMRPLIENQIIISEPNSALASHWPKFPIKFDTVYIRGNRKIRATTSFLANHLRSSDRA